MYLFQGHTQRCISFHQKQFKNIPSSVPIKVQTFLIPCPRKSINQIKKQGASNKLARDCTCKNVLYVPSLIRFYSCLHAIFIQYCNLSYAGTIWVATVIFTLGANFYSTGTIFAMIIDVWPHANWAIVANNFTTLIKIVLIDIAFDAGFLYLVSSIGGPMVLYKTLSHVLLIFINIAFNNICLSYIFIIAVMVNLSMY